MSNQWDMFFFFLWDIMGRSTECHGKINLTFYELVYKDDLIGISVIDQIC